MGSRANGTTYVSGNSSHDSQVVFSNDLLHLLNATQVSQHVTKKLCERVVIEDSRIRLPNRDDVASLDEFVRDMFSLFHGTTSNRLKTVA